MSLAQEFAAVGSGAGVAGVALAVLLYYLRNSRCYATVLGRRITIATGGAAAARAAAAEHGAPQPQAGSDSPPHFTLSVHRLESGDSAPAAEPRAASPPPPPPSTPPPPAP